MGNPEKNNIIYVSCAQLYGALLLRNVYAAAKRRGMPDGKKRPFHVAGNECYEYFTKGVAKRTDGPGNFGVHEDCCE